MKIENAKSLLISLKDQISKNLVDDERDDFLREFDSKIETCPNHSKAYSEFCVKLLERCKLVVKPEYDNVIKSIDDLIILFKKEDSTKEEFQKAAADAADAADAAAAAYTAHAHADADADAYAAYAANAADAAAAAYAAAYAADADADAAAAYAKKEEYKNQSIDLLQVLKKKL